MKIQVVMLKQDDPKKCSAAKLVKFGLAKNVKNTTGRTLILDPFSEKILIPSDEKLVDSVTAIDCSWNLADQTVMQKFHGIHRKLPPLLAGNPINYAKLDKLTSVEAIAGSLYILGHKNLGLQLLDKFKWGHTFFELNQNLLNDYSQVNSTEQISKISKEYNIV
jgi:pre-rRNA-processing protein TSR3